MKKYAEDWAIDKRIPLALIIMLLCQFGTALVWAAQINERVAQVELQSSIVTELTERMARIEERVDNVRHDTQTIKQLLGRLTDRLIAQ